MSVKTIGPNVDPPEFDLGDVQRFRAVFTDVVTSSAVDPTVVKLSVLKPLGGLTTYEYGVSTIQRLEAGNYFADLTLDRPGDWAVRWWSTGNGQTASEGRFKVRQPTAI